MTAPPTATTGEVSGPVASAAHSATPSVAATAATPVSAATRRSDVIGPVCVGPWTWRYACNRTIRTAARRQHSGQTGKRPDRFQSGRFPPGSEAGTVLVAVPVAVPVPVAVTGGL